MLAVNWMPVGINKVEYDVHSLHSEISDTFYYYSCYTVFMTLWGSKSFNDGYINHDQCI